jgi:cation diffusion facilitator family transporter
MNGLQRMALLSIAASLVTMALKFGAWYLTDSVSLFSDAAESLVNLAGGLVAFGALTIAARPADDDHAYGHDKAEYFSSGVEGALIMVAAVSIIYAAVERFFHPQMLHDLGPGLLASFLAALVNFATARVLLTVAAKRDSITLEADAKHLMTDVWTSAGVLGGLVVVMFAPPSWQILDPIMAVAVALNIVVTGTGLMRRSMAGLMDSSLPQDEVRRIQAEVQALLPPGAAFGRLRTRKAGSRRFIEFNLLLPGATSVSEAHALCDRMEAVIEAALPKTLVTIHVEPQENHV